MYSLSVNHMKKGNFLLFFFIFFLIPINASAENEQYTHLHIVDFDNPISFEEIKSRYKSFDYLDGDITQQIKFQSFYENDLEQNILEVKSYELFVSVTNSRNYTLSWTDIIEVRDFTPPLVEALKNELVIDSSVENIQEKILNSIIISDNWDREFQNIYWEGIENCSSGPGSYLINLHVEDSSGNFSNTISIVVHIVESIQKYISPYEISILKNELDKSEILTEFLKNNQIDLGYQKAEITSSYFDSPQKNGIYSATITLTYPDDVQILYYCKIIVNLEKEKKKDDIIIYISLGTILFLLSAGFVIYRKRR